MNVKGLHTTADNKLLDSPCIQSGHINFVLEGKSRRVRNNLRDESLVYNLSLRGTKDLNTLHVVTKIKNKKKMSRINTRPAFALRNKQETRQNSDNSKDDENSDCNK